MSYLSQVKQLIHRDLKELGIYIAVTLAAGFLLGETVSVWLQPLAYNGMMLILASIIVAFVASWLLKT